MLEVTDDSGSLGLVVPATYETFVARNWTFDQLMAHFRAQMARQSLLIWGTGLEGLWKVRRRRLPRGHRAAPRRRRLAAVDELRKPHDGGSVQECHAAGEA